MEVYTEILAMAGLSWCVYVQEKLTQFILASQDEETGGFSDRPGDWVRL